MWNKLLIILNHPDLSLDTKLKAKQFLHILSSPGGISSMGIKIDAFLNENKELFVDENN